MKKFSKGLEILQRRLKEQGLRVTAWWAADHVVRAATGANLERVSRITPNLHVGGQHRRRGWSRLQKRGITAVVNMRLEYDDAEAGVASERHLRLPVVDDQAPTLEQLGAGSDFIAQEAARGGEVYVHCGSGIGRAATMAAAYLISTGLTPVEALTLIREKRPFIRPTGVQLEQLERFAEYMQEEQTMDNRLEIIFARRSIRRYSGEPLNGADIQSLLEAGMAAPSGSNRKPWHFVVATDRATLQALADAHPYGKMLARAEAAIAVCGDPAISDWWIQDCSAATENILVAAAGLGLGGVWLGCHGRPEREQAVKDVLGIPQEIGVLSLLSIGHPAEEKSARTQFDAARVHRGQW